MKRSGPLRRSTPLKSSGFSLRRSAPLRVKSKKQAKAEAAARGVRQQVIRDADGRCEIRAVLIATLRNRPPGVQGWPRLTLEEKLAVQLALRDCTIQAQGVHERVKRSSGGSLKNRANLMAACNLCNGWVEDHPDLAHRLGLVVRPGDPDWDAFGKEADNDR